MVGLLGRALLLATLRPEVVEDAAWLLAAWDHLAFRMTGVAAASLQDPVEAITVAEARAAGLDERMAPPAARAGTVVGRLRSGPAAELGLPLDLPVVAGANDAIATFLGAGLTRPGQAIDTGGTSGGFGLYVEGPVAVPPLWTGPAPLPGLHYVGGAMAGTGKALDWLAGDSARGVDSARGPARGGGNRSRRRRRACSSCPTSPVSAGRSTIRLPAGRSSASRSATAARTSCGPSWRRPPSRFATSPPLPSRPASRSASCGSPGGQRPAGSGTR